jgi:chromosome segregation ATPase
MKDEIKEILSLLNSSSWSNEARQIEDYITNLQEDLDYQRQAEIDYNKKHTKLMRKYKKLQQENERLKNGYCELKVKCNNGECDCTNEEYDGMVQANMKGKLLLEDYKSRIDKARAKLKSMFDNGNEKTILDDLLELDSVLGENKVGDDNE